MCAFVLNGIKGHKHKSDNVILDQNVYICARWFSKSDYEKTFFFSLEESIKHLHLTYLRSKQL